MKTLVVADIKSYVNDRGQSTGHVLSVARNYRDALGGSFAVKVAGGPVFGAHFPAEDWVALPYNVTGTTLRDKWHTFANARTLFRKTRGQTVVLQQSTAITSFLAIALLYRRTSRLYLILYNTEPVDRTWKRWLFRLMRRKIDGILCPNDHVGKQYGCPYQVTTDYLFPAGRAFDPLPMERRPYDFCMVGALSEDKGVVEALRHLAATGARVIVAGRPFSDRIAREVREIGEAHPQVTVRLEAIPDGEYADIIAHSKYGVLNYRGTYLDRSSGVVLDFLFGGTPVVGTHCRALQAVGDGGLGFQYDDVRQVRPEALLREDVYQSYQSAIRLFITAQADVIRAVAAFLNAC